MRKKAILFVGLLLAAMSMQARSLYVVHQTDTIPRDSIPRDSIPRDSIPRDTLARDTVVADSLKAKKVVKKKEETEYEKLMKKGGHVQEGLFRTRHIDDKYYFEVPDSK